MSTPARQLISAGLHAEPRHRVGEPRPVHVHLQPVRPGGLGDGADVVERVDRAEIAGLRDIDPGRLAAMQRGRVERGERLAQRRRVDPAVCAGDRHQFQPAARNPAAFASEVLMCANFAAIDVAPARPDRGQRQRVGGGAGGDREDAHRRLEQFAEAVLQPRRPLVAAIAERRAGIGAQHRVEDLRRRPPGIVAAIVDHLSVPIRPRQLSRLRGASRGLEA